jgi:hypothetical protein
MKLTWRKWFRIVHRDFGYLFFGLTLAYSISGIALNHLGDWNSNYIIVRKEVSIAAPGQITSSTGKQEMKAILAEAGEDKGYKNHYFPTPDRVKVFYKGGSALVDITTGKGILEKTTRRPFFRELNYLHYNPTTLWTWISDVFAGALIVLAITGLFLVKGAKGITRRGAWMTILGLIIPVAFLLLFFY